MHPRRFNFRRSFVRLLTLIAMLACVGCGGDNNSVSSDGGDEQKDRQGPRVAMSKDAFVDYVSNESQGRRGDRSVLFLKLPGKITPQERVEKYSTPIDLALRQARLGKVINGAAMMGAKPFSSVSIEVSEIAEGIEIVIETLRAAGPPPGTEIRYGEGDDKKFFRFEGL